MSGASLLHLPPALDFSRRRLLQGAGAIAALAGVGGLNRAAQADEPLVWYTGSQVEAVDAWVKLFKERTGLTCDYYRAGGLNIAQKFEQEAKAGQVQCSLVGGGLSPLLEQWADRGLLMSYESPEFAHYAPETILPGFHGGTIKGDATTMIYNTEMISEDEKPKTWEDLLDPKWKGKIVMADAGSSSAALHWFSAMLKAKGRAFMEELRKQDPLVRTGSGEVVNTVVSGERPLAAMVHAYHAQGAIARGATNLRLIVPAEGCPVSWSYLCIAANAPNPEGAKKFFDFALGQEAQILWQEQFFVGSARNGLPPGPEGAVDIVRIPRIASSPDDMRDYFERNAEISDEWIELFKV